MKMTAGEETCVDIYPEVFEMSDDKAVVKVNEVPQALVASCKVAAENCPVEAIQLKD